MKLVLCIISSPAPSALQGLDDMLRAHKASSHADVPGENLHASSSCDTAPRMEAGWMPWQSRLHQYQCKTHSRYPSADIQGQFPTEKYKNREMDEHIDGRWAALRKLHACFPSDKALSRC